MIDHGGDGYDTSTQRELVASYDIHELVSLLNTSLQA